MFALKATHSSAYGSTKNLPALFTDDAYVDMSSNRLSSSTLGADIFNGGGFCPVTPDGYGIGYKIMPNELGFSASTFHAIRNGTQMTDAIDSAIKDIASIIHSRSM